jgi:hypothetical protein
MFLIRQLKLYGNYVLNYYYYYYLIENITHQSKL